MTFFIPKHYFQDVLVTKPFAVTVRSDTFRCKAHIGDTSSSLPLLVNIAKPKLNKILDPMS